MRWSSMRSTRLGVAVSVTLLILLVALFCWLSQPLFPPEDNAYVGRSRAEIVSRWGQPDSELDGHYALALNYAEQYPGAKTMEFKRRWGSLYVSVHDVGGDWICFSSIWRPHGAGF